MSRVTVLRRAPGDPLAPARGCVVGLMVATAFWVLMLGVLLFSVEVRL